MARALDAFSLLKSYLKLTDASHDCSDISDGWELWHLGATAGTVALIATMRQLLLSLWPEFSRSSESSHQQVVILAFCSILQPSSRNVYNENYCSFITCLERVGHHNYTDGSAGLSCIAWKSFGMSPLSLISPKPYAGDDIAPSNCRILV